jgi:chloramphenicol-sensitive protein RarD
MIKNEQQMGAFYAALSYFLWGILPIYWKLLGYVKAHEILANRIIWSFAFMLVVLLATNKWKAFSSTVRTLSLNKKPFMALGAASLLISVNWFTYIWAVNNGQMIETSLGYYINPLVSVLLGMIVLKERLSIAQYFSFFLALIGVLILTTSYGRFPWVAMTLAVSFGLYGLAKKLIKVDSAIGLTLETMVITPLALVYIGVLFVQGENSLLAGSLLTDLLLIGAGAATAIPLLYFAKGAQKIPLSMLGFIQYISPTITLILGIFVYGEQFTKLHLLSFTFIWAALTIYSVSRTKLASILEVKWKKGKSIGM